MSPPLPPLVTADWLADHLDDPGLRVADATLLAPDLGRDARAEFEAGHIPGAVFLDLAELRDTDSALPNTLPSPDRMAERLGALGIGDGTRVVVYDASPWHSAARAWWLLTSHGFEAAILDGGLAAWRGAIEKGPAAPEPRAATPRPDASAVRSFAAMRAGPPEPILDARSPARFTGEEGDPHGAAPGHIPGSRNLHYAMLFEADGRWKRGDALAAAFRDAGVDPARPFVATCGSGITAAVLLFGAHLLGGGGSLYDGSWAEWGADPATPKAVGPA